MRNAKLIACDKTNFICDRLLVLQPKEIEALANISVPIRSHGQMRTYIRFNPVFFCPKFWMKQPSIFAMGDGPTTELVKVSAFLAMSRFKNAGRFLSFT